MPVFKGKGTKGNYEPASYGGGSGPGEGGKAHKLRVEQRDEEERLKGVYGFNQLVSDEIRQDIVVSVIKFDFLLTINCLQKISLLHFQRSSLLMDVFILAIYT